MNLLVQDKREHERGNYRSVFGKSTVEITCPFCGTVTTAYIWSLAGGGKRCANRKNCKALHVNRGYSLIWNKKPEEQIAKESANGTIAN